MSNSNSEARNLEQPGTASCNCQGILSTVATPHTSHNVTRTFERHTLEHLKPAESVLHATPLPWGQALHRAELPHNSSKLCALPFAIVPATACQGASR